MSSPSSNSLLASKEKPVEVLGQAPFFSALTPAQLERVAALGRARSFPQDTRIYTVGDVFGWAPLVEGHPRRIATAYCLTACEVIAIDGEALVRLMEGDPAFGYALLRKLAVLLTSEL